MTATDPAPVVLNLHSTLDDLLICRPKRGEKLLDAFHLTQSSSYDSLL